jgi:glycerol-3-phosphate acyltransferase PlsY
MISAEAIVLILAGYALGCFTTGYYLTRLLTEEDIRDQGSGSAGATNVRRRLGLPAAAITFLVDLAKGAVVVWAAIYFGFGHWWTALAMLAVLAGHIWPVQLRFQGGKGVATGLGAVLVLDHHLVLVVSILFVVLLPFARQFVPAGLSAIAAAPGVALILGRPVPFVLGMTALALLVLIAHSDNIRDIVSAMRGAAAHSAAKPRCRKGASR